MNLSELSQTGRECKTAERLNVWKCLWQCYAVSMPSHTFSVWPSVGESCIILIFLPTHKWHLSSSFSSSMNLAGTAQVWTNTNHRMSLPLEKCHSAGRKLPQGVRILFCKKTKMQGVTETTKTSAGGTNLHEWGQRQGSLRKVKLRRARTEESKWAKRVDGGLRWLQITPFLPSSIAL